MEFGRNLRFTSNLTDFPEFSRVHLWTLGIRENAGMIRARSDPERYPKTGVFEPCSDWLGSAVVVRIRLRKSCERFDRAAI